jgi:hypothetical protein
MRCHLRRGQFERLTRPTGLSSPDGPASASLGMSASPILISDFISENANATARLLPACHAARRGLAKSGEQYDISKTA